MQRLRSIPHLVAAFSLLVAVRAYPADSVERRAGEEIGYETVTAAEGGSPVDAAEGEGSPSGPGFGEDPFREEAPAPSIADPLEPVNRVLFVFNDKLYFWVLKPVARGYRAVVPEFARLSVRNFFRNLGMPVRFVNNLLQGKIRNSGVELLRFAINTTGGIGGLFDPARDDFGLEPREEDLGLTLGRYGLGHGVYVFLPLLGPSSLRDGVGRAGDSFLYPLRYVRDSGFELGTKSWEAGNEVSLRLGEYEDLKESAIDPYVAMRDAYSQYRAKKLKE